ncbi:MAG: A/G-specific adenine glycosylase [Lachnospiraceae bacterium]|nr:A/G-specific adenine glycosylase [Lachnospiraceae bacterium]
MKLDESKRVRVEHPFPPLYDKESRILILGSFPSVKSREEEFFYAFAQNRFWRVISTLLSVPLPMTVEEKKKMLHENHIALWDTIASCDIIGSSDSTIRNVVPTDLSGILETGQIRQVYCNGAKSYQYYHKYQEKVTGRKAIKLPSTSPANASWTLDKLLGEWNRILLPLGCAPASMGERIVEWYDAHHRILPWRSDPTPYHVWISEIMLQQTRVEAVKEYYHRWMQELPDVGSLAQAPEGQLLKLWEGLGYYNRVRNLRAAATQVMEDYGGEIPSHFEDLQKLKGIGEYTAGAIASIACGERVPAIDGNVYRVFTRVLGDNRDVTKAAVKKDIHKEVMRVMPDRPGDYNQAIMDIGATICLPNGVPLCSQCPLEPICQAHKEGKELAYPNKPAKKKRRTCQLGVLLIQVGNRFVLHRRPKKGLLPNLWEFPNMELTSKDSTEETVEKTVQRLGIKDYQIERIVDNRHIFSHVEWEMRGYHVRLEGISKEMLENRGWVLANQEEMAKSYAIPAAFEAYRKAAKDCLKDAD